MSGNEIFKDWKSVKPLEEAHNHYGENIKSKRNKDKLKHQHEEALNKIIGLNINSINDSLDELKKQLHTVGKELVMI